MTTLKDWPVIAGQIERRPVMSSHVEFAEQYGNLRAGRPVVLTGVPIPPTCAERLTDEGLRRSLGDTMLPVMVAAGGQFATGKGPWDPSKFRILEMTFSEYLDRLHGRRPDPILAQGERCYIYQSPPERLGPLLEDLPMSPLIPPDACVVNRYAWIGEGTITVAHYDTEENFLLQLRGKKRVLLFSPADHDYLYFNRNGTVHDRHTRVDFTKVDEQQFPDFRKARAYETVLEPGDMLYIPVCWLHHIETVTFGVSVNTWWMTPELLKIHQAFDTLCGEIDAGVRREVQHMCLQVMRDRIMNPINP
uniref:JmjC domain protein n=1 Tax=Sorangium cellulosum TaxID=56 RepID=A0A3S7UZN7_SORCE|nr:JmjC domain protein [Sorangium cellulosum]